jgi:hypothetical protein
MPWTWIFLAVAVYLYLAGVAMMGVLVINEIDQVYPDRVWTRGAIIAQASRLFLWPLSFPLWIFRGMRG